MALAAAPAWGFGYTPLSPPPEGESSHLDIINGVYGAFGSFTADANGRDFDNGAGGVTLKRVFDFDSGNETVHILFGNELDIDQIWTDGVVNVTAEAKFASLVQSFGWNQGEGGGLATTYYELLTQADIGGPPVAIDIMGDFLWGAKPNGDQWWSKNSLNPDSATDHMLSYFVEGLPGTAQGEAVWLLFWEDLPNAGDADYNDFVVEVRAVPEPGTASLAGLGLLILVAMARRGARRPTA